MEDVKFKCNALIESRKPVAVSAAVDRNVERFGNWIGGSVLLRETHLVFSTNAMNAAFQEDASDVAVPYPEIASCELGRMMIFLKTVDLEIGAGKLRFRCMGSSNDKLLAELQRRRSHVPDGAFAPDHAASVVDQLTALADVPVSASIPEIATALSGTHLMVGVAEPDGTTDAGDNAKLEFLVGHDETGASWLYLYTSEEAMIRGGLTGSSCVTMPFEELFDIAYQQSFGGFIIDAGSGEDCLTIVPAEYFNAMAEALSP